MYIPGVPAPSFVGYEAYELSLEISFSIKEKQGQIHFRTVMDGQAGAVMQNLFTFQKYFGQTD